MRLMVVTGALGGTSMRITNADGTVERKRDTGFSWEGDEIDWQAAVNIGRTESASLITAPKR